jgi:hypothetical protein
LIVAVMVTRQLSAVQRELHGTQLMQFKSLKLLQNFELLQLRLLLMLQVLQLLDV